MTYHILVAEDDSDIAQLLKLYLDERPVSAELHRYMEEKKKPSPWAILELATLLRPEDFQKYCDTHPEEAEQAKKILFEEK